MVKNVPWREILIHVYYISLISYYPNFSTTVKGHLYPQATSCITLFLVISEPSSYQKIFLDH